MAQRLCYQCDDNLEEIAERRNAQIRAWGQEQLRVADEALFGEVRDGGDWDLIEDKDEPEPPVDTRPEPPHIVDAEVIVPAKTPKVKAPASS